MKNSTDLTDIQKTALQGNLDFAKSRGIIFGSRIEWARLSYDEQLSAYQNLNSLPDTSQVTALKSQYADEFLAMSTWLNDHTQKALWSSTGTALFMDRDSWSYWISLSGNAVKAFTGELRLIYPAAGAAEGAVNLVITTANGAKKVDEVRSIISALDKATPFIDFMKSCATAYPKWTAELKSTSPNYVDLVTAPLDCLVDEISADDTRKLWALAGKSLSSSVQFTNADGEQKNVIVAQAIANVVSALFDAYPTASASPSFQRMRGATDITLAILDTIIASNELTDRADTYFLVDRDKLLASYDVMQKKLLAQRTQQLLSIKSSDYYEMLAPTVMVSSQSPSVFDTVSFWLTNAYQTVTSVVWNFGTGIAEQTAAVANHISAAVDYAFTTTGVKDVTATYKDAVGNVLGSGNTTVMVSAPIIPLAEITSAMADASTPGVIPSNGSTDDNTPTLSGTLTAILTSGQKVNVYDGSTLFAAPAVVTGTSWTFTPAVPLAPGIHVFTAEVAGFDGTPGARSAAYTITVQGAGITAVAPAEAMRTVSTTFDIVGAVLPTSGLAVSVPGDARATCATPTNASTSGFKVACTLYTLGNQTLEVRAGGQLLGSVAVAVTTNITGVTWSTPSNANSGTVHFGEIVTYSVAGINMLVDPTMGFAIETCGVSNTEVGTPTNTVRQFTCWFNDQAGAVAGQKFGVVADAPSGQRLFEWYLPLEAAATTHATGNLTDTGITADQCYQAGSYVLVSCTSAAAIAFNASQDGMIGPDVSTPDSTDGKLGFSYSTVPNSAGGSYAKTECVKDNITGLTWEGKTADGGLRDAGNTYTNYGDGRSGDASAYVTAVNATGLCGYTDWRLPSYYELQSIVDYSVASPGPSLDSAWFVDTRINFYYWASSPYAGDPDRAWSVYFIKGSGGGLFRYVSVRVRLVR